MCGIFGVLDRDGLNWPSERLLAGNAIAAHRGPDGEGAVWFDTRCDETNAFARHEEGSWSGANAPTLLLCHRRLAIIDLSQGGRQPMSNEDGSLWLSYNGELYNFLELRDELATAGATFRSRSDTEVLLKAYEFWGPDAVTRFAGMWAFALIDFRRRQMLLSRDRFGIKPLHYCKIAGAIAFASEIKQLLALPACPRAVNEGAVYDYLQYEAVDTGRETFFADIYKVLPGHNLLVSLDTGELSETRYYALPDQPQVETLSAAQAGAKYYDLLKESVRIHLRSDVPVGTCLSGGLDSSSIALLMREIAEETGPRVERHAFNCHFDAPEANEREFTELSIEAAKAIPHFTEPTEADFAADLRKLVWHQDEPFGSTSIYAQWAVFRLVKSAGVKVVLDGQGADEMLGGYASTVPHFFLELAGTGRVTKALWESWLWSRNQGRPWASQIPLPTIRRALALWSRKERAAKRPGEAWLAADFAAEHAPRSRYVETLRDRPFAESAHFANLLYQFFFRNNLPALLRFEDRNSMAFSVEARVPFLDHRLVEFAFSLPSDLKFRGGYTKRVLRDGMAGKLPDALRLRKRKMGFATPEQTWQAKVLKELVHEALASEKLNRYLDRENAAAHYRAALEEGALSFAPWRWVNLLLWKQEFQLA